MDINAAAAAATSTFPTSSRHHHRKPTPSDRFLGIPPHTHHLQSSSETELTEYDIFCSSPDLSSTSSSTHPTPSRSPGAPPRSRNHHGILAALPGGDDFEVHSVFNHKASAASVSSSSTSSASLLSTPSSTSSASRLMIPKRPPAPPPRMFHLSAPVNVPVLSEAVRRSRAARGLDDIIDDNDEEEEENNGEILPPHEIVAGKQTPILSCSVLEGVGRTLKGRDLRQVRNAVWRTTGFLD